MTDELKIPHSLDAERAVLSACSRDQRILDAAAEIVDIGAWYLPEHRQIWEAMSAVHGSRETVSIVSTAEQLKASGTLESAGGPQYLADVWGYVGTTAGWQRHARIVAEHARKRAAMTVCWRLERLGYDPAVTADEYEREMLAAVLGVTDHEESGAAVHIRTSLRAAVETMERRHQGEETGLPVPWPRLHDVLGGLEPFLHIVAGRPGMGKTAYLSQLLAHNAARGTKTLFFSLEMPHEKLSIRLLSAETGIPHGRMRQGSLRDTEWGPVTTRAGEAAAWPLWVDDTPAIRIGQLVSRARRHAAQHGLDLIGVDYLQLIAPDHRSRSREEAVADVSRGLRALARTLRVPVYAAAQLRRAPAGATPRRPSIEDLRESGQMEQDAATVCLLHRPGYYDPEADQRQAECIVGKNRDGDTGVVPLDWAGELVRFQEPAQSWRGEGA